MLTQGCWESGLRIRYLRYTSQGLSVYLWQSIVNEGESKLKQVALEERNKNKWRWGDQGIRILPSGWISFWLSVSLRIMSTALDADTGDIWSQ